MKKNVFKIKSKIHFQIKINFNNNFKVQAIIKIKIKLI